MKRWAGIVAVTLVCVCAAAASDGSSIPRSFTFKVGGDPIWISAKEGITAGGTLRSDVDRPGHLESVIRDHREKQTGKQDLAGESASAVDPCDVRYEHVFSEGPDEGVITSEETLRELLATRSVVSGTVVASEVGLHLGIPHTVLAIDADGATPKRVHLMFPRGRLRFEGVTFCNEDATTRGLPTAGDPIVFIASDPVDTTGSLYTTSWIVYEQRSSVITSTSLRLEASRHPRSVREFAERLRHKNASDMRFGSCVSREVSGGKFTDASMSFGREL